jgi:monovalent cation:H+ antiporter-2, CPA2 family
LPHATPLIATIVAGLVIAFVFGLIAQRLRLPVLIGYLLAGVVVGPFTPGYVADQSLANELAELGIILLMFGVGLHFSVKDLMAVRRVAVPGAIGQIACAVLLGMGLAHLFGWSLLAGFVFGLALSVASTVVLLRALQERRLVDSDKGRIAVGWLIVEDLAMVVALVLLPALAGAGAGSGIAAALGLALVKIAAFTALMLVVGRRFVPWLLHLVAHSGSRELFRLAVLAIALGVAFGAAMLFGVSFALGAFFAGMILAETPLSQRAAEETLPLRDAFAVLFFVSVGMLFNPTVLLTDPLPVLATLAIIMVGKSIAAFGIVRAFGRDNATALTIAASLAQIGEFSFILATLGTNLDILPREARDLILAGAILSIMLNPLLFAAIDQVGKRAGPTDEMPIGGARPVPVAGHVVLVGCGRVGSRVAAGLLEAGERVTVIETEQGRDHLPEHELATLVVGNAAKGEVLDRAAIGHARMLFVAIPASYEAGQVVEQARRRNPALHIVARTHADGESEYLHKLGADHTIMGEREIARRMIDEALVGVR